MSRKTNENVNMNNVQEVPYENMETILELDEILDGVQKEQQSC